MRIGRDLVNRALLKAGQTPLTEQDIENNSESWKSCKNFYLSTILETLARTPWTSAKRRTVLERDEGIDNISEWENMYKLPVDCARALRLRSGAQFSVEGGYLYTDDTHPVLLYITNGREYVPVDKYGDEVVFLDDEPVSGEPGGSTEPETAEPEPGEPEETEAEDDIPGYRNEEYEPSFWEYVETRLASKIVLKITGDTTLYNLLFSEAELIEQAAAKASKAASKSKPNGQPLWTESVVGAAPERSPVIYAYN